MSEENVEVVRRGTEEWLRGNLEAWVETIDPGDRVGHLDPPASGRSEPGPGP